MTEMLSLDETRYPPHILNKIKKMSPSRRRELIRLATPRIVEPYVKHIPHPVQQVFLGYQGKEIMYGGSAGGGKSDALLMAALQYVDVPGYSALILRRTWPDLNAPGAILDRAKTWLEDTDATPREGGRIWMFPNGGRLQFGYIARPNLVTKFQSAEYQFVGFDELTHFEEQTYTYMFSRIRRPQINCLNCQTALRMYRNQNGSAYYKHVTALGKKKCKNAFPDPKILKQYPPSRKDGLTIFDVPLRMRSATNPGGIGHQWVKARFIEPKTREAEAKFIPARLIDNPSLDQETYMENLMHLTPVDRERLLNGDWDIDEEGDFFARHWFDVLHDVPRAVTTVRFWDLAATVNDTSDWTVGAKVSQLEDGTFVIEDIVRLQARPKEVERTIRQTAMIDGIGVPIRMEQEPGSAGVNNIDHYRRSVLFGFDFDGTRSSGSKEDRAKVLSSSSEAGNVKIVAGRWNVDFLDEAALFPNGAHDDQVDAVAGAYNEICFGPRGRLLV
jgi:predicted phage terminase large subunit-like protein